MLIAVLSGYVALASFLQEQVIWIAMIGAVLLIVVSLVDEYVGVGISPEGKAGRQIMHQVGLSRSSLQQISILSNGLMRVILFAAARPCWCWPPGASTAATRSGR